MAKQIIEVVGEGRHVQVAQLADDGSIARRVIPALKLSDGAFVEVDYSAESQAVQDACAGAWDAEFLEARRLELQAMLPAPLSHLQQRDLALRQIDLEHSKYLVALTGGATIAERDTWKSKEEAAKAFLNGKASAGQSAMLASEASGAGISEEVLAQKIVERADAFLELIGVAAGVRSRARLAVLAATSEDVALDEVGSQLAEVFASLAGKVAVAISELAEA